MSITTLRIKKEYTDKLDVAVRWYSMMSTLNDFKWTPLEIRIIAFTAVEGNISSGGKREKFISIFKNPKNSLSNAIGVLRKEFYLIREDKKIKLHPQLFIDFNNDILLQLNISIVEPKG